VLDEIAKADTLDLAILSGALCTMRTICARRHLREPDYYESVTAAARRRRSRSRLSGIV
jgi:hypothetical protein